MARASTSPYDSERPLPAGKLPPDLLASLLSQLPASGDDVIVGARYGEDAAVVKVGDYYLVLALDPVTLSEEPGRLAVQINANDIAVMGAEPRWLLAAILLPAGSTATTARTVMEHLRQGCLDLGVDLVGGHTEVSPSVTQPVVAACMIGRVSPDRLVTSSGARPGDALLLAGPIAVEGTGILAREHRDALRERGVSDEVIREAAALLDSPGISVLPAARAILSATLPHAMHDPTEGGLLSAVREMAAASGVGVRLEAQAIPVLASSRTICDALGLDPLGLLASGSLLAAIGPGDVDAALRTLQEVGIQPAVIGTMLSPDEGMILERSGVEEPLPELERDELARWMDEKL
jgi:hydrogenase maturation factor